MDMRDFALTPKAEIAALTGFEFLSRIAAGDLPQAPFLELIGARLTEVEEGRAVFRSVPSLAHYNPLAVGHGGYAATLLDSALGCAIQTRCPAGQASTTLELKVNLVRAIRDGVGELVADGTVVHFGRTIATSEARLYDSGGKLYAHGSTTCLLVDVAG